MFGYKCEKCGKGTVRAKTIPNHETKIDGIPFIVENAVVGICDKCEAKYFNARETKKWRDAFFREQTHKGGISLASEISNLREEMGLSVADFARLIGCSRQALYLWESLKRDVPQSRMADLMIKLVRESLRRGPIDVIEFLTESLRIAGVDVPAYLKKPIVGREPKPIAACSAFGQSETDSAGTFDSLFPPSSKPLDFSPRLGLVA